MRCEANGWTLHSRMEEASPVQCRSTKLGTKLLRRNCFAADGRRNQSYQLVLQDENHDERRDGGGRGGGELT